MAVAGFTVIPQTGSIAVPVAIPIEDTSPAARAQRRPVYRVPSMTRDAARRTGVFGVAALVGLTAAGARVSAQAAPLPAPPASPSWTWTWDTSLFLQLNYQQRKFTDFWAVEAPNWLMGSGRRLFGAGTLEIAAMVSLEAFTLEDIGSPQVFQTGETFAGGPLIDYQHPHDLFMQLGARYDRLAGGIRFGGAASIVGAPAFGPAAFMHRPSAEPNPTAPLAHHHLDSLHITPGVVTGAVSSRGLTLDASAFRGREPDEDRLDLDLGALDSWSVRGSWTRGRWSAQVSGASVTSPEALEPGIDVTRLSASVGFEQMTVAGGLSALAAWGQMRDVYGTTDAYLVEGAWQSSAALTWYGRVESVVKNILTAGGQHPPGFTHAHEFSRVGALTIGMRRALVTGRGLELLAGGDVTGHRTPSNLKESYGQPWSYHVYVQLRRAGPHRHR